MLVQSSRVNALSASATAFQRPSVLRCTALRNSALSLKGHFDRVEVRAIGGQLEEARARSFDRLAYAIDFVRGQIVHHLDIAGRQRRGQDLVDIGAKSIGIHRAIEQHRGVKPGQAQASDKCGGFPVAVRHAGAASFSARRPSAQARHLGVDAAFVDEDQPVRIEFDLGFEPGFARCGEVVALLLAGVGGLF
jgi:hypothetical protein